MIIPITLGRLVSLKLVLESYDGSVVIALSEIFFFRKRSP